MGTLNLNIPEIFERNLPPLAGNIWQILGEEEHAKYKSYQSFWKELKKVHHKMSNDIESYYQHCRKNEKLDFLARAFCKEVFSLMEVDIYLLNKLHPYDSYNDKSSFLCKFKKTFKYYVSNAPVNNKNIEDIFQIYASHHFVQLRTFKEKRDSFNHPKELSSLNIDEIDFLDASYDVFKNYDKMYMQIFYAI